MQDINEFARYCLAYADNIWIVDRSGRPKSLSESPDQTIEITRLWAGRFEARAWERMLASGIRVRGLTATTITVEPLMIECPLCGVPMRNLEQRIVMAEVDEIFVCDSCGVETHIPEKMMLR